VILLQTVAVQNDGALNFVQFFWTTLYIRDAL